MRTAKYPGYRTMTCAQRYNARMARIFDDAYARARAQGRSSPWGKPLCACGHEWDEHKRQTNGAHGCVHFGCGCRDVVLPLD